MKMINITFIICLLSGCTMNLRSTTQITNVLAIDSDSSFVFFLLKDGKSTIFRYNPYNNQITKYDNQSDFYFQNPFLNDKEEIRIVSHNSIDLKAYLVKFKLNGEVTIIKKMPFFYKQFCFDSNSNFFYGVNYIHNQPNLNTAPTFSIDKFDSLGNVIEKMFHQEGYLAISNGITKDNRFLIYYFIDKTKNEEGDTRCVAIDTQNSGRVIDLRDVPSIKNDSNIFSSIDMFDASPSNYQDSVYVVKYGNPDIFMFSVSSGKYRKIESLGFNESKYFAISNITEFNILPFQALVAEGNLLLIRNTETGKVIKIEPDRKPDEVIPLKIINPGKME